MQAFVDASFAAMRASICVMAAEADGTSTEVAVSARWWGVGGWVSAPAHGSYWSGRRQKGTGRGSSLSLASTVGHSLSWHRLPLAVPAWDRGFVQRSSGRAVPVHTDTQTHISADGLDLAS